MSDVTPGALSAAHDANWIATFGAIADVLPRGVRRAWKTVTVVASGTPVMNKVIVTDPSPDPAELDEALALVRAHRLRFEAYVREDHPSAVAAVAATGLQREWTMPCMACPLPVATPVPVELELRRADAATLPLFREVAGCSFEMPPAIAEAVFPPEMLAVPEIRAFVGLVDGRPVACAASFQTGQVIGIYTVGTVPDARGRGYGAAVTAAAMRQTAAPASLAILQASAMGRPVYERMGFRTVHAMAVFEEGGGA